MAFRARKGFGTFEKRAPGPRPQMAHQVTIENTVAPLQVGETAR